MTIHQIEVGKTVVVFDRYRFALPLKARVVELLNITDGVRVTLLESNNAKYPVGCENVWVHLAQLRVVEEGESK